MYKFNLYKSMRSFWNQRWLLSRGQTDRAISIIRRFALINKKTVDERVYAELKVAVPSPLPIIGFTSIAVVWFVFVMFDWYRNQESTDEARKATAQAPARSVLDLMKTPRLRRHTVLLTALWAIIAVVYDGHARNTANLGLSVFLTFSVASVTELPADLVLVFFLDRWGRRALAFGSLFLAAVFSLATLGVPIGKLYLLLEFPILCWIYIFIIFFCRRGGYIGSVGDYRKILCQYHFQYRLAVRRGDHPDRSARPRYCRSSHSRIRGFHYIALHRRSGMPMNFWKKCESKCRNFIYLFNCWNNSANRLALAVSCPWPFWAYWHCWAVWSRWCCRKPWAPSCRKPWRMVKISAKTRVSGISRAVPSAAMSRKKMLLSNRPQSERFHRISTKSSCEIRCVYLHAAKRSVRIYCVKRPLRVWLRHAWDDRWPPSTRSTFAGCGLVICHWISATRSLSHPQPPVRSEIDCHDCQKRRRKRKKREYNGSPFLFDFILFFLYKIESIQVHLAWHWW